MKPYKQLAVHFCFLKNYEIEITETSRGAKPVQGSTRDHSRGVGFSRATWW